MAKILVVDDEQKMRHLLSIMLSRKGYQVDEAEDGLVALNKLIEGSYDLIITDIRMPRMDGHQLLKKIKENNIQCPVVFITAFASVESAVEAMQEGVVDYISKPFEEDRILFTVERTLSLSKIMAENRDLRQELKQVTGEENIIYQSPKMTEVIELACQVAIEDSAVILYGESGTGKDILARFIHRLSDRNKCRFVPVNCAAIPQGLVESELFGHEKGAFTGADKRAIGKFETASGGTLFMDEVGDLPLEAQAKLLRVLQDKKIQRVGGTKEIPVDVRIICATNQDLEELVKAGKFRSDLFYRINVFPIELPPLRERKEDIAPLSEHFVKRLNKGTNIKLSDQAIQVLKKYSWPGNVRELNNVLERACILARKSGLITQETLSFLKPSVQLTGNNHHFKLPEEGIYLEEIEMDLVKQALDQTDHNQSAAARLLGLTRSKFRVLHKQFLKNRKVNRKS